jgi:hypothetical protein
MSAGSHFRVGSLSWSTTFSLFYLAAKFGSNQNFHDIKRTVWGRIIKKTQKSLEKKDLPI